MRPKTDGRPIVVLLVDDQAFVAAVVGRLLEGEADIELHHCQRAKDALARIADLRPTVILQDLVMPDVDGLSLIESYRADPRRSQYAVVALSGSEAASVRAAALAAGADEFVLKLPSRETLLASLRRHARSLQVGEYLGPAGAATTIDRAVLAALCHPEPAGASGFLNGLIDQFVAEVRLAAVALDQASSSRDMATLRATAHRLKGTSSIMGAIRLAALCDAIESDTASSPDRVLESTRIGDVCDECARTVEAFTAERSAARATAHTTDFEASSWTGGGQR